jgi:hypothetical protein
MANALRTNDGLSEPEGYFNIPVCLAPMHRKDRTIASTCTTVGGFTSAGGYPYCSGAQEGRFPPKLTAKFGSVATDPTHRAISEAMT